MRALVYLAEGFLGGAILFTIFSLGQSLVPDLLAGNPWALGIAALFVVLLVRWAWFLLWGRGVIRREGEPRLWMTREWLEVYRLWWVVALILLVGGGLVDFELYVPLQEDDSESLWIGALFVALAFALAAGVSSTRGEIDTESLTLTTLRYGEWRELDLRTLTAAKRLTLGRHALLWLSVTPGVEKRTATQGVYAIPAGVLDRAWPAFEAGLDAPVSFDADAVERGRFFRRVNRFVATGYVVLALGFLAGMIWLGSPLTQLLTVILPLAGFGFLLLKLAA